MQTGSTCGEHTAATPANIRRGGDRIMTRTIHNTSSRITTSGSDCAATPMPPAWSNYSGAPPTGTAACMTNFTTITMSSILARRTGCSRRIHNRSGHEQQYEQYQCSTHALCSGYTPKMLPIQYSCGGTGWAWLHHQPSQSTQ